jgi:nucleoid-associated protein YgaU
MGMLSFIKEAGEKLFGHKEVAAAQQTVAQAPDDQAAKAKVEELNRAAGDAIENYIKAQNLSAVGLTVTFDGGTVTVYGVAPDQETKEKIVLCCGNVTGVEQVADQMSVDQSKPEAVFYTVVKGDTLSAIAKAQYGNANKYMVIFEANKPMLSHPDKIYPGQMLRIPPLEG